MKQNYCLDCEKKISRNAKRCNPCAQKGHLVSEETKRKISNSLSNGNNFMSGKKGKSCPHFGIIRSEIIRQNKSKSMLGEKNHNFGIKRSEETKRKISLAQQGEKHWNWQGGITCEPYCYSWGKELKQMIKNRDNNAPQDIGYWYEGPLSVHHIDYDKKNCHPFNLIAVSKGMNTAVNYHREFYTEWFQIAMSHRLGYNYD